MGAAYNPAAWSSFFSAQIGASAALAGLIFVAVSINLNRIITSRLLSARAIKALVMLTGVLLMSTVCLEPEQSPHALGWKLSLVCGALWLAASVASMAVLKNQLISRRGTLILTFLLQGCSLPGLAAGLTLLAGRGGGLRWMPLGIVLSYVAALIDAWVLLVEINR